MKTKLAFPDHQAVSGLCSICTKEGFCENAVERNIRIVEKALEYGADSVELKLGQAAKQGFGREIKFMEI